MGPLELASVHQPALWAHVVEVHAVGLGQEQDFVVQRHRGAVGHAGEDVVQANLAVLVRVDPRRVGTGGGDVGAGRVGVLRRRVVIAVVRRRAAAVDRGARRHTGAREDFHLVAEGVPHQRPAVAGVAEVLAGVRRIARVGCAGLRHSRPVQRDEFLPGEDRRLAQRSVAGAAGDVAGHGRLDLHRQEDRNRGLGRVVLGIGRRGSQAGSERGGYGSAPGDGANRHDIPHSFGVIRSGLASLRFGRLNRASAATRASCSGRPTAARPHTPPALEHEGRQPAGCGNRRRARAAFKPSSPHLHPGPL